MNDLNSSLLVEIFFTTKESNLELFWTCGSIRWFASRNDLTSSAYFFYLEQHFPSLCWIVTLSYIAFLLQAKNVEHGIHVVTVMTFEL
jgi:hypothetical protein